MKVEEKTSIVLSGNHLELRSLKGQKVVKELSEYQGKENVIIEDLEDCEVFLPFAIKCLYMKNVKSCKIYVGACSGASFYDYITDSKIMIQSHQIRIHNSQDVAFYLTAKSNPIIEHCTNMSFGPYLDGDKSVFVYDRFKEDSIECGLVLEPGKNFYDRVLDFNWLK